MPKSKPKPAPAQTKMESAFVSTRPLNPPLRSYIELLIFSSWHAIQTYAKEPAIDPHDPKPATSGAGLENKRQASMLIRAMLVRR